MFHMQSPQDRAHVSLAGPWHVVVDPYETGSRDIFGNPNARGFHLGESPATRWSAEYDFDASPTVQVPGDWNSQREDLLWYEGILWYFRRLDARPDGDRLFLHIGGANYVTEVWLNGTRLGEHRGGFTPFTFEVTDLVTGEGDFVVARVENTRQRDRVPTLDSDWWNYGGLTREILLVGTPATYVRDWFIRLGDDDQVHGEVFVDGAAAGTTAEVRLGEATIECTLDATGRATFVLPFDGRRWSPDAPTLHALEIRCGGDVVRDRIGLRTLARRGDEILLNGEPIHFCGISVHEEALTEPRRAHSEADARELLAAVQALGCNFARLAHYPHNAYMARVADELGLLLWEEIPVYWAIDWTNPDTLADARGQLSELILRDRNRASVALWSVANETPVGDDRNAFLRELVAEARALDPSSLLTAALFMRPGKAETADGVHRSYTLDDPLAEDLDVVGCNQYLGWYYTKVDDMVANTWHSDATRPLVMSEFGAGARRMRRGGDDERWTEDYQAAVYRAQFAMQARIPFLRGTSPWILKDFRTPKRPLPGIQDYFNRKGLVDERGERKLAWQVVHDHYATLQGRKTP